MSVAVLFALCASVLAAQQAPAPQEPPPVTFRVEVNYVEVDAVVTDAQGRVVTDLTLNDFEVLEDGRPQKVTAFSLVNLPIERPARPLFAEGPVEPDVQVNTAAEGRIYMIVLDDLHTTFSNSPRVKRALKTFLDENFGTNDLAAIVYTGGRGADGQDFTNNRRLLMASVDKFFGRNLRSEALEITDALNRFQSDLDPQGIPTDPLQAERAHHARTTLTFIKQLAEFMGGIRGRRKAMLLVSEGVSYDIQDVFANASASIVRQDASDAAAAATRGNVAIYAIDPRGLSAFDETIEVSGTPSEVSQFSVVGRLRDSLRLSQDSLRALADGTGGFAAVNQNDFSSAFARVVRENSTYYMIGYYPTNDRRDGRFRKLEVRVKRPGLQVRSRRGYVAPRGRAPETKAAGATALGAAAATALNSPIPIAGIPLSLFAAAYKGTAPNAAVAIALEMRADDFRFVEKNGTFTDRVEVVLSSVDSTGKVHAGDRHTLTMTLSPDSFRLAREHGIRVLSELALPPGRYQLRAAAAEEGGSRSGTVLYDLEVPNFYSPGFSMSGLSLSSASAGATPTVRAKDPLADVLPGPSTTVREFQRNDQIALFTEFYENATSAPPHMLDFSTTLRADGGRVVFEDSETRSSTDLQGTSGGYGYRLQIPLRDVAPGTYILRVEGRSRATGTGPGMSRDVLIRVR